MKNRVAKFIKNPKKALWKLAWPIIIAMSVQTLYNVVDTAFVGRLGADAIAALTFSFPLFFIFIALLQGVSVGMGSRISRYLGAKQKKAAENAAMHGILVGAILSIIIVTIGLLVQKQFFAATGATGPAFTYAIQYMTIIFFGILFMFPSFLLGNIFSAQGDTKTSTKIHVSAIILNIILDPIFIYTLNLKVRGAALATLISFVFAFALAIYYLKKKSYLNINLGFFKYNPKILKDIIKVGLPASLTMIFISIYVTFINYLMASFGTKYVAAFGLISKLHNVALMPMVAIATALITLVGMFHGAKRYHLLRQIILYGIKTTVIWAVALGAVFFSFPTIFLRIFTSDPQLLSLAGIYLRIDLITFPLVAITLLIGRSMQGIGSGLPGLVLNFVRVILIGLPLSFILVLIFNFNYLAIPVATIIGTIIADIIGFVWLFKKLRGLNESKSTAS